MYHFNGYFDDRQGDYLQRMKQNTGIGISEYLRRLLDYSIREEIVNELVPAMSGQLQVYIGDVK